MTVPATIRNNNPGAMWPGSASERWGATGVEQLTDAQRNRMATFPSKVSGGAAQFDLLSKSYVGMTLRAALDKWSGSNDVGGYLAVVCKATGLSPTDILTAKYVRTPKTGVRLARAMARHETGYEYPMTQAEWREAHDLALGHVEIPAAGNFGVLGDNIAAWAEQQMGKGEKPGPGNYQHMDDWYAIVGLASLEDNATPWCELFTLAAWRNGGAKIGSPDDPHFLLARNHLTIGTPVNDPSDLRRGDATVWPRGAYPLGHVGIAIDIDVENEHVTYAEGNVDNKVTRRVYTFDQIRSRALGSRRPEVSKALPNGLKPVFTTIKDSYTLKALLNGIAGGISAIGAWMGGAFGVLPDAVANAEQAVSTTERTGSLLNITMLPGLLTVLAVACMAYVFFRALWERRPEGKPRAAQNLVLDAEAEPAAPRHKRPKQKAKAKPKRKALPKR